MKRKLSRWDALAVRQIRNKGWPGMSEAAATAILAEAYVPYALLSLTLTEMMERAGYIRKRLPSHRSIAGYGRVKIGAAALQTVIPSLVTTETPEHPVI